MEYIDTFARTTMPYTISVQVPAVFEFWSSTSYMYWKIEQYRVKHDEKSNDQAEQVPITVRCLYK